MKLREISADYKHSAALLHGRIEELRRRLEKDDLSETERLSLRRRIAGLYAMRHDMLELAALTEHYYERGFHRNEDYSL